MPDIARRRRRDIKAIKAVTKASQLVPNIARELVLDKEPTAIADTIVGTTQIKVTRFRTGMCPHCGQDWAGSDFNLGNVVIGLGGDELCAWEDAARKLELIK